MAGLRLAGDAFGDVDAGALELLHLVRVVREETDFRAPSFFRISAEKP